jgi:hypothetical protein
MTWTQFHDMHSGGGQKLDWHHIHIEAPEEEAKRIFFARFGHNPERVTCTCCGEDYSITEGASLAQLTGYERGCRPLETPRVDGLYRQPDDPYFREHYYLEEGEEPRAPYRVDPTWKPYGREYKSLDEYMKSDGVLVITVSEIKPEWRTADVPRQGYVWVGE